MSNIQNIQDQDGFDTASSLCNELLHITNKDSYKKISLFMSMFMPKFNDFAKRYFLFRLLELYSESDKNIKKGTIGDMFLYYGKQYNILDRIINYYYKYFYLDQNHQKFFVIFQLLNVDEIEEIIETGNVPYLIEILQSFIPIFKPNQIAFLYSKCKGKSRNRQEFIKTLKYITGIEYRIQDIDFMNFEQRFQYEDVDQIFKNIVMGYVGLGDVEYNKIQ